jgi:hypothetical protein
MLLGGYAHMYLQARHGDRRRCAEQWTMVGGHEQWSTWRGVVSH